jgi:plasmid stability protein
MVRKPTELRPLMIRIPEGLRRKLEKEAARQTRSMNAEIIHRLNQSFPIPGLVEATATAVATAVLEKFIVVGGTGSVMGQKLTNIGTKAGDEGEQS